MEIISCLLFSLFFLIFQVFTTKACQNTRGISMTAKRNVLASIYVANRVDCKLHQVFTAEVQSFKTRVIYNPGHRSSIVIDLSLLNFLANLPSWLTRGSPRDCKISLSLRAFNDGVKEKKIRFWIIFLDSMKRGKVKGLGREITLFSTLH